MAGAYLTIPFAAGILQTHLSSVGTTGRSLGGHGGLQSAHSHKAGRQERGTNQALRLTGPPHSLSKPNDPCGGWMPCSHEMLHAMHQKQGTDTYPRPVSHGQHLQHSTRLCHGREIGTPQIHDGSHLLDRPISIQFVFTTSASRSLSNFRQSLTSLSMVLPCAIHACQISPTGSDPDSLTYIGHIVRHIIPVIWDYLGFILLWFLAVPNFRVGQFSRIAIHLTPW